VNGDDNDDLLVGAPFYQQADGDEGIVYVYVNNGTVNLAFHVTRRQVFSSSIVR
jgi:hypothetical protein